MKPVSVEVITYAPTVFTHCQHCELAFGEVGIGERLRRQEAAEALPDDLARDFQALSDWVHALLERRPRGSAPPEPARTSSQPSARQERPG